MDLKQRAAAVISEALFADNLTPICIHMSVVIHDTGHRARRHNGKFVIVQKRLRKLQEGYDNGQLIAIEYITGVSYNLAERH